MQTLLPYPNFTDTAKILDSGRLGAQRLSVVNILYNLRGRKNDWLDISVVRMWRGYEPALILYGQMICIEWMKRGNKDTCMSRINSLRVPTEKMIDPNWLGNEDLHLSHQALLLRRDEEFYGNFFAGIDSNIQLVWPVSPFTLLFEQSAEYLSLKSTIAKEKEEDAKANETPAEDSTSDQIGTEDSMAEEIVDNR